MIKYSFMLLTQQHNNTEKYLNFITQSITLGVNCIQFREKHISQESLDFLLSLQKLLQKYKVPLIINDDIQLAKEINADGVHLGQSDTSVFKARQILGKEKIIGLSIEDPQQIDIANNLDVNYVACSAVFPTKSKSNIKKIWQLEGLQYMCEKSIHPVIAIGGINESNVESVIQHGAYGIAVISALHDSNNLPATINKIKQSLEENHGKNKPLYPNTEK
ncbi:MAG: thiamine phosphate synthase [Alphaproteobacteria bacterium]|jgi:thiamine-phosphate pyrophosphorylase|nr:thiamine phosphate synthase [Alphaproteobacteria bacterium]